MEQRGRTSKKPKKKDARKRSTSQTVVAISLAIISIFVVAVSIFKISDFIISGQQNNFPKLEISLSEVPIEQINIDSKNIRYPNNTATLTQNYNSTTFSNVEVKGRGNFTWAQAKKPYQIKLDQKSSLLDLNPAKNWLLLANYLDGTHLRNDLAFYLEKILGEPYALNGNFVELFFDNQYYGLYYLSEKVEIKKSRVDLKEPTGILVELDNIYGEATGCHYDVKNNCLTIADATNPDTAEASMQSFIDNFNEIQIAIKNQDFKTIENLIDVDSFARYYLLSEFIVNPDAYNTSLFFYKDGKNDKIHAGPGWDFDIAFSYPKWVPDGIDPEIFYSPFETSPLRTYIIERPEAETTMSSFFYDIYDLPEFSQRVREIYQKTLSNHSNELLDYIKSQADYVRDAAYRDQKRWKLQTDFNDEVERLIDWVAKRYSHFEEIYGANSVTAGYQNLEENISEN